MANIKEVAKKAGVSISTVSYAMNNSPKVNINTKEKIIHIAQELGYHPNGSARSLKMRKNNIIGLFLKDFSGPYNSDIIEGVEKAVSRRGYEMIIASVHDGILGNSYNLLREGRVDGAIIFGTSVISDDFINEISTRIPIVLSDKDSDFDFNRKNYVCVIVIDNYNGAAEAVKHLISQGYRKIGYVSGSEGSFDNKKRFQAYKDILEDYNIPINKKWIIHGDYKEDTAYNAMKELIKRGDIPEAFFSANDQMAIGVMHAFEIFDLKVPKDIAIVGFDDISLASIVRPPLTTVHYERYEMGKMAVDLIFDMLEGNVNRRFVTMSTKLVVRESCGERKTTVVI